MGKSIQMKHNYYPKTITFVCDFCGKEKTINKNFRLQKLKFCDRRCHADYVKGHPTKPSKKQVLIKNKIRWLFTIERTKANAAKAKHLIPRTPFFTVNIAIFNQRNNIPVILEALKNQTYSNFEVSITDDGSSDGTKEYCQKLMEDGTLPFTFRYLWQEDKGFRLAKSKNLGINTARGKYFLSLEGDVIPNDQLLSQYKQVVQQNEVVLGVRHEIKELPTLPLNYAKLDDLVFSPDFRLEGLNNWQRGITNVEKPYMWASGCNLLLPTKELKEIGGWDEGYEGYGKDDLDVAMRLMHFKGTHIKPCISAYCYHIDHPHGFNQNSEDRFYAKEKELGL